MATILDYMDWRGDLSLKADKFNAIDGLILANLSYVDFEGIVPGIGDGEITLEEASRLFFEMHTPKELEADKSFISFAPKLLQMTAKTDRFRNARLRNYVNKIDLAIELQFAALEIVTDDGVTFISYRGTDDNLVGWKEDFNLSFRNVPAEDYATDYLDSVCSDSLNRIRLGGHSKGGHLAIYASSLVSSNIVSRIDKIYNFDGPGFNRETFESEQFRSLKGKIEKYIPETSIIGRLLYDSEEPVVVKSTEIGIMQHNPMSWQIMGKEFITCPKTDYVSDLFDETMTGWLEGMDNTERRLFVDDLFAVFEASGCRFLSQLGKISIKGKRDMIERISLMSVESQNKMRALSRIFFINWGDMIQSKNEKDPIGLLRSRIGKIKDSNNP
ncbi:MAG: DUF2974 domain-containing protein [Saccharofermentans sp.]|nr:DUF2974 domain-containing protein [Saccharofermentans sp.]